MNYSQALEHWAVTELHAKVRGKWADIKAPCHDDNSASGRINLEDGWFWCHACSEGCWSDQLASHYNLPAPPAKNQEHQPVVVKVVGEYIYTDKDSNPLYKCVKKSDGFKKSFSQVA